ncbi:MAG: hypothetical protein AAGF23_11410 [Acidobacteriota bacterium]
MKPSFESRAVRICIAASALLIAASSAGADGAPALQTTFLSELPEVQERGELQLETVLERLDDDLALGLGAEWGLTDAWQLEVEIGGLLDAASTGLESVEIGALYGRTARDGAWSWAAGAGVELRPNGLDGGPDDAAVLESSVLASRTWGVWGLFAELSGEWVIDDGEMPSGDFAPTPGDGEGVEGPEDEISFGVGVFVTMPWGAWIAEVAAERELDGGETEVEAAFGPVWRVAADAEIGLAAVAGVDGGDDGVIAAFTVEF